MRFPDRRFWEDRRVFVTGHMGFKGSWLLSLLSEFGAKSVGFGKDDRAELLYNELDVAGHEGIKGDVNDLEHLEEALKRSRAEIVFHLAAQPIVLASYEDPIGTIRDNVLGTAHVLDAARRSDTCQAVVVVTSDKVYANRNWTWPYRENDRLGGRDPYSASKAAAEIITASMVDSFFREEGSPRVATARAGNVIGGGDWAANRLLPDAARAFRDGRPLTVRNPDSTRPWQHVLEPLAGYMLLAEDIHAGTFRAQTVNFGPHAGDALSVRAVADMFVEAWGSNVRWNAEPSAQNAAHEAKYLAVDISLAMNELAWQPRWRVEQAVPRVATWYSEYSRGASASDLVRRDISDYLGGN